MNNIPRTALRVTAWAFHRFIWVKLSSSYHMHKGKSYVKVFTATRQNKSSVSLEDIEQKYDLFVTINLGETLQEQIWNLNKEKCFLRLILMSLCCLSVWAVVSDKLISLISAHWAQESVLDTDLLYLLQLEHFIEVPLPELWMSHLNGPDTQVFNDFIMWNYMHRWIVVSKVASYHFSIKSSYGGLLTSSSEISAFLSSNVKLDNQVSNCCGGPGKRQIHGIHIKNLKNIPVWDIEKTWSLHTVRLIAVCSRVCLKTVESSLRGSTAGMYLIIHVHMQVCI